MEVVDSVVPEFAKKKIEDNIDKFKIFDSDSVLKAIDLEKTIPEKPIPVEPIPEVEEKVLSDES